MKIAIKRLREIVSEEVFRAYMRSAGYAPMGVGAGKGTKLDSTNPLPGLGYDGEPSELEKQDDKIYGKEQQKSQLEPRIKKRKRSQQV